ncbi:hypothetical protein ACWDRB_55185 [Nonomuraea sp. NPDC003707]
MDLTIPLTLPIDLGALLRPLLPAAVGEARPWVAAASILLIVLVIVVLRQMPPICSISVRL